MVYTVTFNPSLDYICLLYTSGKQDLVGVCMRMALVEAMYKEEKPFLIFDDPFVNLDDNNIKGAMKLLDEIAKNYQVIYFTCSESRIHN